MQDGPRTFRDHFLSIYQLAAADYASQVAEEGALEGLEAPAEGQKMVDAAEAVAATRFADRTEVPSEPGLEDLSAIDVAKVCAALGVQYLEAKLKGDKAAAEKISELMPGSKCDPRWAKTLDDYVGYFGPFGTRREIPYVRAADVGDNVIEIESDARIGIVGDWGTGAALGRRVLERLKEKRPTVLVHLGDIYYSGTEKECRNNFETVVNEILDRPGSGIPIYTISGNHDMYSGGVAYYSLLTRLNPAPKIQKASFFCLRTKDKKWQLLGMDTGLHDYSPFSVSDALTFVEKDEQEWLEARVREFPGKTILLSHHQLFSAFSAIGKKSADGSFRPVNPNLEELLRKLQEDGKPIAAWFWGHEHNLCVYKPYAGLECGRCLGCSAIPVFKGDDPYKVVEGLTDPPVIREKAKLAVTGDVYAHGFAMLEFGAGGTATAEYFQVAGADVKSLHTETF